MIPLSIEKLSEGRPAMVQLRIFTGSPKEFISDMFLEQGIPLVLHMSIHSSVARCRDHTQKHTWLKKELLFFRQFHPETSTEVYWYM